jgi:hypothetical protein
MKKWIANKIFIIALIAIAIIGLSKLIDKWRRDERTATNPVLTQTEKSKVIIDSRSKKVTIVKRKGDKQVTKEVIGARKISVTLGKDGKLNVYARNKGFVFEPGVALGIDEKDSLLGLDAQFFYWNRLGLLSGMSAPPRDGLRIEDLRVHAGVCYVLDQLKMPNTSLFMGYNTKRRITLGARVSF